ncbi:MAG: anti-sigma factor [Candidatus Dormibacteraeota bacterium]|nr:anti-sigma factor [Candidatus Dormibacteraeota bacterium]
MAQALSCPESEELLALAGLGVLPRGDSAALDAHLRHCAECRRAAAQYREAVAMLPNGLDPVEPPAEVRRSLMAQVYAEARPATGRRHRGSGPRWSLPRRGVLSLAGGGVALAALAIALVVVLHPADGATRTYTVYGTTSAPAVRGSLTYYTDPQQAVMTVSGLPKLVPSTGAPAPVYEVWLVRANGTAQGVAFLEQSPTTASWSTAIHADLSQYVAVAATAEPAGGSPAPTGPQLLTVQVTRG